VAATNYELGFAHGPTRACASRANVYCGVVGGSHELASLHARVRDSVTHAAVYCGAATNWQACTRACVTRQSLLRAHCAWRREWLPQLRRAQMRLPGTPSTRMCPPHWLLGVPAWPRSPARSRARKIKIKIKIKIKKIKIKLHQIKLNENENEIKKDHETRTYMHMTLLLGAGKDLDGDMYACAVM